MATPTIFSLTMLDTNGVKTTTRAYTTYTGATETVDALIGSWLEFGGLVDDASNSQITGGAITIPVDPDAGWKAAPVEETDNSDVIVLNFKTAATKYVQEFVLPGFLSAMLSGGNVDLAQAALAALIALLNNTAGGGTVDYSNMAGQAFTTLVDGFQTERKSGKLASISKSYPS